MKAQQRRDEIDERRLVGNLGIVEQACFSDVAGAMISRNSSPVICALQRKRGIFRHFQFDDDEPPVAPERQQINRTRTAATARITITRSTKLRVQGCQPQTRVKARDVAPQQRFEPCFRRRCIPRVPLIEGIGASILTEFVNKFCELRPVVRIERSSRGLADAEPDLFMMQHAAHAREGQSMKPERLATACPRHINRLRRERHDAPCRLALLHARRTPEARRRTIESLPKFGQRDGRERLSLFAPLI